MTLEKQSPCKINLLLNILGKRPDGFHELETVLQPVALCDTLSFSRSGRDVRLSCSDSRLPSDSTNLVHRAATAFLQAAQIQDGVEIHLEKRIPMAAGLGGGSANAAVTLLGLNELFGQALSHETLGALAAKLGSDVPFFLQAKPALALGRGELIEPLEPFPALRGTACLLIQPGFGIATAWAYQRLAHFAGALHGIPGRARKLVALLQSASLSGIGEELYNALEMPAFDKYPVLALSKKFCRDHGAIALMSGSGSTTFAIASNLEAARKLEAEFKSRFGPAWTAVV